MTTITPIYAHPSQSFCLTVSPIAITTRNFAYLRPKPIIRIFPTLGPQRAKKVTISMVGLFTLVEELVPLMVRPYLAGWGVAARSADGRIFIFVMFGSVITTEAHLAHAGTRTTPTTPLNSSLVEALSFLGPHGLAVRGSHSCIFYDSKHAAGFCLGTVQSRANVTLGLACQRL